MWRKTIYFTELTHWANQWNLLLPINCGGHIGKVGQSQRKLDNFEEKKWILVDILGIFFMFLDILENLWLFFGHFLRKVRDFWTFLGDLWLFRIFGLLPILLLGFWDFYQSYFWAFGVKHSYPCSRQERSNLTPKLLNLGGWHFKSIFT